MTASLSSIEQEKVKNHAGLRPLPASFEKTPLQLVGAEGQLQVHTAPYRGSFSVVLSQALRAAGLGSRVMVAQFLKGGVDQGPDRCISLCGTLEWLRPDITCCITEQASKTKGPEHSTNKAVNEIWETCRKRVFAGDLDQLVLDEVGLAIELGYLGEEELLSTLEQRPGGMDVILTGPSIPHRVIAMADQITELRCFY